VSGRPILFAHRGGGRLLRENTLGAFRRALAKGATGLETDVRLTRDRQAVLHHDESVRRFGVLHTPISDLSREQLPRRVPTLSELYQSCGADFELSIDLKDTESFATVVEVARRAGGPGALGRLWLCGESLDELRAWRAAEPAVRLCRSADEPDFTPREAPSHLAALRGGGVDAVNFRARAWTAELVTACHTARLKAFAWDANRATLLKQVVGFGVDAVYADRVRWMVATLSDAT
jgi:glycerophosphoryl diester phosphodiesterase